MDHGRSAPTEPSYLSNTNGVETCSPPEYRNSPHVRRTALPVQSNIGSFVVRDQKLHKAVLASLLDLHRSRTDSEGRFTLVVLDGCRRWRYVHIVVAVPFVTDDDLSHYDHCTR